MQRLPLDGVPILSTGWQGYTVFLQTESDHCIANHRAWKSLPEHLIDQLADYLLPVEYLADPQLPYGLIHADITRDHILGRLDAGRWVTLGLIDFGDARVGNVYYDLAALHFDLFRGDKRLLRVFLEAYGLDDQRDFNHKAMSAALLHQFNVFSLLPEIEPRAHQAATLSDLARMIWDFET
jgi:Ser/Thr protein kinase RdoA (MazF antagonist)